MYRCAASAVSWIRMRRKIWGPAGLYDPGKIELLSVDGSSPLTLVLGAIAATGTARAELDKSAFLVLATRDGLRWILLSRILFCCTKSAINDNATDPEMEWRRTLHGVPLEYRIRLEIEFRYFRLSGRG